MTTAEASLAFGIVFSLAMMGLSVNIKRGFDGVRDAIRDELRRHRP